MEEQPRKPVESWWLARGLVAGKALLLLGSQLLFGKQHKLVERDLKINQDTATKTNQNGDLCYRKGIIHPKVINTIQARLMNTCA